MDVNKVIENIFESGAKVLHSLHGGMMNESFVILSKGKKYVLYLPTKQANEMVDRSLEEYNHKLVYKLGITSENMYFDTESGIKVNRFIEGDSLNRCDSFDASKIAVMLRILHHGSKITEADYHPFSRLKYYEEERIKHTAKISSLYAGLRKHITNNEEFLTKDKLVLSHNDFQKSNIIKTPEDNYYLIDFEFASNNYDLYDVACFGNDNVSDGVELLKAYKNGKPSKEDYKRFYLWRIFISLQWYNVALIKHYRGEGEHHNINFLDVAKHFIENALQAYKELIEQ